jgi:hypothetical protein
MLSQRIPKAREKHNRMLLRLPNESLDPGQARKDSPATHLDHQDWTPTPYISFTMSASAIEHGTRTSDPRRY